MYADDARSAHGAAREWLWSAVPGAAMRVYVATSWKNVHQPDVVAFLRSAGSIPWPNAGSPSI